MSLNRHNPRRDANELAIVKALEKVGANVVRLDQPCDLLVHYRKAITLLEVKDPAKPPSARRLTASQERYSRILPIHVVLTPEDAFRAVGVGLIVPVLEVVRTCPRCEAEKPRDDPAPDLGGYR